MADSPWTQERDAQLRSFWDAGYSGTEIGKRMGITKSAAIGRAHRLKLAPRVSPIATISRPWTEEEDATLRRLYDGFLTRKQIGEKLQRSEDAVRYRASHLGLVLKKVSPPRGARVSGAPRKRTPQVRRAARASAAFSPARGGRASFPPPEPNLPGVAPETLKQRRVFSNQQCKAPLGERGAIRFCDAPVIENAKGCASPYCLEHYALFYIGTNKDLGAPGPLRWR